jgi:hypothetical protein
LNSPLNPQLKVYTTFIQGSVSKCQDKCLPTCNVSQLLHQKQNLFILGMAKWMPFYQTEYN